VTLIMTGRSTNAASRRRNNGTDSDVVQRNGRTQRQYARWRRRHSTPQSDESCQSRCWQLGHTPSSCFAVPPSPRPLPLSKVSAAMSLTSSRILITLAMPVHGRSGSEPCAARVRGCIGPIHPAAKPRTNIRNTAQHQSQHQHLAPPLVPVTAPPPGTTRSTSTCIPLPAPAPAQHPEPAPVLATQHPAQSRPNTPHLAHQTQSAPFSHHAHHAHDPLHPQTMKDFSGVHSAVQEERVQRKYRIELLFITKRHLPRPALHFKRL
jgi:hypothetical protein